MVTVGSGRMTAESAVFSAAVNCSVLSMMSSLTTIMTRQISNGEVGVNVMGSEFSMLKSLETRNLKLRNNEFKCRE